MSNMSNTEAEIMLAINTAKIMLPHMVNILKIYFDEFKNAGFDDEQALELTKGFQATFLPKSN